MQSAWIMLSLLALVLLAVPTAYLLLLALASLKPDDRHRAEAGESTRFAIAIPAHNEAPVIGGTVQRMLALEYPRSQFDVHVIADNCQDGTAEVASRAGAVVHVRRDSAHGGKGAALQHLFSKILPSGLYDAVVVFDADTRPSADFLRVMDRRLASGEQVIQGRHVIDNPQEGWYARMMWAQFIIDNRVHNLGRSRLGWSAKHMGDSICLRTEVLEELGWGEGLTEDYQLRQRLLLKGIRIAYEPAAIGRGQSPASLRDAGHQRVRWLTGSLQANAENARRLLVEGWRRRNGALLDGGLQAYLPSYSTLILAAVSLWVLQLATVPSEWGIVRAALLTGWGLLVVVLGIYPVLGLAMERSPWQAYAAVLFGPFFVLWRSSLAARVRLNGGPKSWVRTPHRDPGSGD